MQGTDAAILQYAYRHGQGCWWIFTHCDAPRTSEELPVPTASSPTSPTTPAVQVKQYSGRHNAISNKCFYDKRREFVNSGKHTNHASLFLPQQAPLVSQAHLLSVVRKVERSERFKGKLQQKFVVKSPSSSNRGKTMTSLSLSRQKAEGKEQQYSVHTDCSNSETDQIIPIYKYKTNIYTLKPSESEKEQRGRKFKRPGAANCQNVNDVMDDDINRGGDVNRLVARERYATTKHSFSHIKEFLKTTLNICKQSLVQLAIILAVVINLIGSGLNMNLLKLVCLAGLAVVVCQECDNNSNGTFSLAISVLVYVILAVLRGFTAAITNISEVLGSYIQKVMGFDNKEVITRCVGVLQNTIMRGVTILPCYCTALETTTFAVNVFGGKHINAYIFPYANVYASWIDYFDTYTRNLESEYKIMIFCKLVYLYICASYLSWVSCEWATLSSVILYTLVYLSLKWINSVIRIHDKYQSCFLVGIALTYKASSQIRYILLHYRSNWRELRPLVTPWANCIKESIEPCIGQKQFMPSHAQVSHLPLSLLSPFLRLLCFGFCCSYYYYCYCCCYEYLLVKGSHKSSGYENKPEPEYNNDFECKTGQNLLSLFLLSSLPMLLTLVCGAGNLTHTRSPACLSLPLSFSLLMTVVCGAGNLTHTRSPACLPLQLSFSLLMTVVCGAGNLTHTTSPARLYILLSFSLLLTLVCGAGNLTHTISPACLYILLSFSLLLTIVCGAGNLTHTISPAYLLVTPFFPLSSDGHWMVIYATTAVVMLPLGITANRYSHITLLQEDIHGFRDVMLLAIGTLYMFSYRTVGMEIDGNCCPYLLSPTPPAPRTRYLGSSVARFTKPFESRPADTVRRELFKQLATQPGQSGWIAPTAILSATPRPLERATEACFAHTRGPKCRKRLQF